MAIRPRRLPGPIKLLMIVVFASATLASSGCGGDNPARLAGTVEPKARPATSPNAKPSAKEKARADRTQP